MANTRGKRRHQRRAGKKRSGLVLNPSQKTERAHTKQGGLREFKFYVPKVGKLWKERWGKQTGGVTTAGHFRTSTGHQGVWPDLLGYPDRTQDSSSRVQGAG